jgi:uncharacterized protein YdhG (YjbR/CyaY superfamily)
MNTDEYVAGAPERARDALQLVRGAIRAAAPDARETISYDMPAFALGDTTIVWFGAFKAHVGFYPGAAAIREFANELSGYTTAKGSVRFPLEQPMPVELIQRMVRFRVSAIRPKC